MALLSAEHTEFTWNQKTWEDKLIQVEVIPPPEAGVGALGQPSVGLACGEFRSPSGTRSPPVRRLGAHKQLQQETHPGNQEARRRPRGSLPAAPKPTLALGRG